MISMDGAPTTWATLKGRSFRLANALIRLGVTPGDRVTFMFHNTPAFVETNYAVQVAGGIPVPLNYRFTASEVERQLEHSEARVVLYDAAWSVPMEEAASRVGSGSTFVRRGSGGMDSALDYEELLVREADRDPEVPTGADDTAAIIYTGGTTGFPKGVMLSYGAHSEMFANLLSNFVTQGVQLDLTREQLARLSEVAPVQLPFMTRLAPLVQSRPVRWVAGRPGTVSGLRAGLRRFLTKPGLSRLVSRAPLGYMVPSLPFFHSASYMLLMMGAMVGNLRFVLPGSVKFDPSAVLAAIEAERPFLMANVPTGWKKLVSHGEAHSRDLSSVRVCITGAGVCPVELKERIFETFHQVDGSITRQAEGTGLGLTIAHKFVELHRGRIWVESEEGQGSTFYFTVPAET